MSHDNSWKFYCKYSLNLCFNEIGLTISFGPLILKQGSCCMNNASRKFYICHFSSWYLKGIVISWNSLIILKTGQRSYCVPPHFSQSVREVEKSLRRCSLALPGQNLKLGISLVVLLINVLEVVMWQDTLKSSVSCIYEMTDFLSLSVGALGSNLMGGYRLVVLEFVSLVIIQTNVALGYI